MRRVSRAALDDPLARQARRLLLIGVTGSGKTTLARGLEARCGIPAVDVDAMAWRPGWVKTPDEELAAAAARVAAGEAWVMDSAWAAIRPVVLTREPVCGDNVESVRNVFSRDSILAWHFRSFAAKRAQMLAWEADPDVPPVLRLRTAAEVDQWLASCRTKG